VHDLVIRGGTVVDGTGVPARAAPASSSVAAARPMASSGGEVRADDLPSAEASPGRDPEV
jgi:hypothetical protein